MLSILQTDSWHKKTSKLAHFYITPKYKKWTIHNGHLWFRHISAFRSLVLQHSLYFSPNCKQRFCAEYQWCKAGFFCVNDFQRRMGDAQLISAGQVTHRGTNRKHPSSKELSFISAQPVMQFSHSPGTPCRENLKWPLSFLHLALQAFSSWQAAVVLSVRLRKLGLWYSSLLLQCCLRHEHLACFVLFVLSVPGFTLPLWSTHVKPSHVVL